jgi:hypothetical protein
MYCFCRTPQFYTLWAMMEWRNGDTAEARRLFRLGSEHKPRDGRPYEPLYEAWSQMEQHAGEAGALEAVQRLLEEKQAAGAEGRKRTVPAALLELIDKTIAPAEQTDATVVENEVT